MHGELAKFVGEIVGTMILVLLGDGVVACCVLKKSKGENGGWIVITAGWGLAVAMAVYVCGWVSGADLNPAVTFGKYLIGMRPLYELPIYFTAQMIGALIGAVLVWLTYQAHFRETDDADLKLAVFCTAPAIRKPIWNFVTEFIGTAMLVGGILGIVNSHNAVGAGYAPFMIGMLIFAIGMSLGGATGYAINPARDLGPRIAHAILPIPGKRDSDWGYAWVPVLGPLAGGGVGAVAYKYVFLALT